MKEEASFTHYQRYTPKGLINDRPITSSTRLILSEAKKLGMNIKHIIGTKTFILEHKGVVKDFYYQNPGSNSASGMFIVSSKRNTKNYLKSNGLVVPNGFAVKKSDSYAYKKEVYMSLKKPLVIKPDKGTQGKAITVGVKSMFEYNKAIKKAANFSKNKDSWLIVEEQLVGFEEYRVLATKEKVIGVIKRNPANVVGDGFSNIRKLIKIKNSDPRRGEYKDHPPLFKIIYDEEMKEFLKKQNLKWWTIPQENQTVYLRGVSNISMGGDSIDFTDDVHKSVKEICLRAINLIPGLELGGVDFMSKDITKEQTEDMYSIIEINNSPGIDIHDFPYKGVKRNAGIEFLKVMFGDKF